MKTTSEITITDRERLEAWAFYKSDRVLLPVWALPGEIIRRQAVDCPAADGEAADCSPAE